MTYLFHICIGMMVVILQTTVFQQISLFSGLYDLLIVQVIYLGLYRHLREGLIIIGLLGVAMDSLTGGPYGLFPATYFCIFAGIRWALTFFRLSNTLILPLVFAFGVIVENLIHLTGVVSFDAAMGDISSADAGTVVRQLIWAMLTGPVVLILLRRFYQRSKKWARELLASAENNQ